MVRYATTAAAPWPPCARALTPDSGCSQGSVMVGRLVLTRLVTLDCLPLHTTSGNAFSKSSSFGASCGRVSVEDEEEAKAVRRRHPCAPGGSVGGSASHFTEPREGAVIGGILSLCIV